MQGNIDGISDALSDNFVAFGLIRGKFIADHAPMIGIGRGAIVLAYVGLVDNVFAAPLNAAWCQRSQAVSRQYL